MINVKQDDNICAESTSLMAFMTLLITGKQRGIEFIDRLVELAGNSQNQKCRIVSIKVHMHFIHIRNQCQLINLC